MPKMYPKMKAVFPWYKVASTIVNQGKNGLSHEIEDEIGHAEHLLSLLDGTFTLEEIVHAFTKKFPDVTSEDVLLAISSFDEMRLLENADASTLDAYKIERYSRNLGFLEMYGSLTENKHDFQERLCNSHVILLGRPFLAGIFLFGGANFGLLMMQSNLIYVVMQYLHTSNLITGVVLGCGGIGASVGAAIASRIIQ